MSSDVLVIGAGVCGLTAIKACLEEGLNPVCFERYDDLGEVTVAVCKTLLASISYRSIGMLRNGKRINLKLTIGLITSHIRFDII